MVRRGETMDDQDAPMVRRRESMDDEDAAMNLDDMIRGTGRVRRQ